MPVIVVPLLSTLIVGFAMLQILGPPMADSRPASPTGSRASTAPAASCSPDPGAMMAVDLGGPVNKVAYTFGVGALASGSYEPMAAVMIAGMTPPLAMALATVLRPKLFTDAERKAASRPGCSAPRSSPRARSRSRPPIRCG